MGIKVQAQTKREGKVKALLIKNKHRDTGKAACYNFSKLLSAACFFVERLFSP